MKKFLIVPIICIMFFSNGCSVILPLYPLEMPYEEQVVGGKGQPKILVADISGVITEEGQEPSLSGPAAPSPVAQTKEILQKAELDPHLAGVVLKINSPGGSVTASDIIYHEIMRFKEKKKIPVYVCITDVAASGGYYIAAAADKIIAHPTTITGSIGVIAMKISAEGLLTKIGIASEVVKSGEKKDFWSPFRPATPEERAMMQEVINGLFARFIDVIYAQRKNILSREQILTLADGRIYTADQALKAKLIDGIGYFDDVVETMKKDRGIKDARVVIYTRPGAYKPTIYSAYPTGKPMTINLISINAKDFVLQPGVKLMYLWMP